MQTDKINICDDGQGLQSLLEKGLNVQGHRS